MKQLYVLVLLIFFSLQTLQAAEVLAFKSELFWMQKNAPNGVSVYSRLGEWGNTLTKKIKLYKVDGSAENFLLFRKKEFQKIKSKYPVSVHYHLNTPIKEHRFVEEAYEYAGRIYYTLLKTIDGKNQQTVFEYSEILSIAGLTSAEVFNKIIEEKRKNVWTETYLFKDDIYQKREYEYIKNSKGQVDFIYIHFPPFFLTGRTPDSDFNVLSGSPMDSDLNSLNKMNALEIGRKFLNRINDQDPHALLIYGILLYNVGRRKEALHWYLSADSLFRLYDGAMYTNRPRFDLKKKYYRELKNAVTEAFENFGQCDVKGYIQTQEKIIINHINNLPLPIEKSYKNRNDGNIKKAKETLLSKANKFIHGQKTNLLDVKNTARRNQERKAKRINETYCF